VYSWPNTVLPFFGGFLSDKLGSRLMLVIFAALITAGQVITAFGCTMQGDSAWYTMWAGRTVFGFGGESLSVAQSALVAQWFAGKELAFALGLNLALARVGSVINDVASAQIATHFPVYWAFWAGAAVCAASMVAALVMFVVDQRAEDLLRRNRNLRPLPRASLAAWLLCLPLWRRCGGRAKQEVELQEELESLVDASLLADEAGKEQFFEEETPKEEISMSAVRFFPLTFWLLTLSCVCTYVCVLCFNNFASGFVAQKWLSNNLPLSQVDKADKDAIYVKANNIMLITYLTAGLLAPFVGAIIDKVGLRAVFNCASAGAIVGVHAIMAYTDIYPIAPLVMLGVCYSVYASALWPSVALVTEPACECPAEPCLGMSVRRARSRSSPLARPHSRPPHPLLTM
jgi:hypothetical protein